MGTGKMSPLGDHLRSRSAGGSSSSMSLATATPVNEICSPSNTNAPVIFDQEEEYSEHMTVSGEKDESTLLVTKDPFLNSSKDGRVYPVNKVVK